MNGDTPSPAQTFNAAHEALQRGLARATPTITVKPLVWAEWRSSDAAFNSPSQWHAEVGSGRVKTRVSSRNSYSGHLFSPS